ncbi:LAETG motif-containing sortase-dependent surface protein [Streptomyces sp. LaPpAH-108]|uniref:LAETG motif-containing sortase-dependent surface protein n=1 Tax=Streptomyces sp. LaPpAH-108 TaxID=1155714 RepID=UPI0003730FED|nr:LAETG motif-containing sortase-dependent surface protein [Streptomyces sp. LaPpAH-108]
MSIARRVTARRLLGTGAASLALCAASVAAASGAWAHGAPGGDGWKAGGRLTPGTGAGTVTGTDACEFSLDGTRFFASVKVDDQNLRPTEDGKVHIKVRTAGDAASCTASLASYLAHGATWATSGQQALVGFDTVSVKRGETGSLDIAVPDAGCFAQVDLYRGAVKFDGDLDAKDGLVHGDLPKGPDHAVIKDKLIAAWNGGTKECSIEAQPTPAAPTTPAETASPSATAPESDSGSVSPSASAPESAAESASPSTKAESGSSASPSASVKDTAAAASPSANGGSGDLAETGGGSNSGLIAGAAAALVAAGAAAVVVSRRKRATQH